jgi:hypothetical protein
MMLVLYMACSSSGEDTGALCNPVLPEETQVISPSDGEKDISRDDAVLWVCYGASATVSGKNAQIYVDSGGTLVLSGKGGTIWVENAATANITGSDLTLYSEPNADVQYIGELKDELSCNIIQFNDLLVNNPCP